MYVADRHTYLTTGIGHAILKALHTVDESSENVLGRGEAAVGEKKDIGEVFTKYLRTCQLLEELLKRGGCNLYTRREGERERE